jgi:Tfp pilus assembly protein PilF
MLSSAQERTGDLKAAETTLRQVLAKDPNNATALNNLGYFLADHGERLEEALSMIQRAVRAEPTNASYLDSYGWAYFKLGKLKEAERYLSDAARRNPASATIQEHLGDLFQRLGQPEKAQTSWRKALSLAVEAADTARIKAKLNGETNK